MGLFSGKDPYDDSALIKAARKRILAELEAKGGAAGITNNVYGGGSGGGLMERMNGAEGEDPSLRDYFVDISREDMPEINEKTGKPKGWNKKVHRHTSLKGK